MNKNSLLNQIYICPIGADGAHYVETIKRDLVNGSSKENIGHHVLRRNQISHCEQAGIVGSLGAIFSTSSDNAIHDIHVRRLFSGHEMAGIEELRYPAIISPLTNM